MPIKRKNVEDSSFFSKEVFCVKGISFSVEMVLLLLIMLLGLFLRVGYLEVPPFWVDESISSTASLNILEKGIPLLDSGVYYGRALVFHYTQAISFIVLGVSDFSARFPSVFFGLLTILLAYLVGKEYSKEKYSGLVCALLMSVFFLEVFFSKQARFYQLFQLAFFASLFFLYKSRKDSKWLIPALLSFLVAVDTQPAGLVLVPFFVLHILFFNLKKWFYSLVPIITFILEQTSFFSVTASTSLGESYVTQITAKYALLYFSFTSNMRYMLLFFIPGAIWAFFKNKILTTLLILPSLIVLLGVLFLEVFAFRYAYLVTFPLVIFSSLFIVFLIEKYRKLIFIALIALILIPSNLIYPFSYTTMLIPSSNNLNDFSAPEINFKDIPTDLLTELKTTQSPILTHYSPPVEWYIRKPDYVLPFTMTGTGSDQISRDLNGKFVDVYSGARMIYSFDSVPLGEYYYIEQGFAFMKLKGEQRTLASLLKKDCLVRYRNNDLGIFECNKVFSIK